MSTGKAAKLLEPQRWEREGRLIPAARTDSNRRLYTEAQLREFIRLKCPVAEPTRIVADRVLFLVPAVRIEELPKKAERGAEGRYEPCN